MTPRLAHLLLRLYPRRWRARYADELEDLLLSTPATPRAAAAILLSALREHLLPTRPAQGALMATASPRSLHDAVRLPSAFLPLAMSLAALGVIAVAALWTFAHTGRGLVPEPDEGAAAHLWQLLMAGQLPFLLFFALKWLPRSPRPALFVLSLQAAAILAAMAPVFLLHL